MRSLAILVIFLVNCVSLQADGGTNRKVTALYMISEEGDWIGQGENRVYYEGYDGHFTINSEPNIIRIGFNDGYENWSIEFKAPEKQILEPGIYKDAERYPFQGSFQPGLNFSGNARGSNSLTGEFEILEITYNNEGKIESFAANLIQNSDRSKGCLFSSIRYNSSVSLEPLFYETFEKPGPIVATYDIYVLKKNLATNDKTETSFTEKNSTLAMNPLPYGGEGIEVVIYGDEGDWVFDFSAPIDGEFTTGSYENAVRYPFQGHFIPGISILTQDGEVISEGEFNIIKLLRGKKNKIKALVLDFKGRTNDGQIFEGIIRYCKINDDEEGSMEEGSYSSFGSYSVSISGSYPTSMDD